VSGPAGTPCPACESTTGCDCDDFDVLGAIVERHPIPASPGFYPPAPAAPVESAPRDSVPFIASRSEIVGPDDRGPWLGTPRYDPSVPVTWPTDRYIVRAVIDDKTCPACSNANGVEVIVMAGKTPTMHRCEHIDDGSGIMCRCRYQRVQPAPQAAIKSITITDD